MALERPTHLTQGQTQGLAFSEAVRILRTVTEFNYYNEATEVEAPPLDTLCATEPGARASSARLRQLSEAGVQLSAVRTFWTAEELQPQTGDGVGDILVYPLEVARDGTVDATGGERFRVRESEPWGGFYQALAVRIEGQAYAGSA